MAETPVPANCITDFCYYHSGLECPRRYFLWASIQMVSTVAGRRFYLNRVYENLKLTTELYTCLVGVQGTTKSVTKDAVRNVLLNEFPDIPLSASVETGTTIAKAMANDDCIRAFSLADGTTKEYRPFCFVVNELASLLTFNATSIINFLVDIWGQPVYHYRTEKQGSLVIESPYLTVLACATTEYITDQIKERILTGGFARRMIFVNLTEEIERKTAYIPEGGQAAYDRAIAHLHKIRTMNGPINWRSVDDWKEFEKWRTSKLITHTNPNMAGFLRTKPDLVLKVMIVLSLAEYDTKLELRKDHMDLALDMFDDIEPDMEKLFIGAGKNPMATNVQLILDSIDRACKQGHPMSIIDFKKLLFQNVSNTRDIANIIDHLEKTKQVFRMNNGSGIEVVLSRGAYESYKKKQV